MKHVLALALVVAFLAVPAMANTVTIMFNGTDGVTSSLWWGGWGAKPNDNTGAEPGRVLLSRPQDDWYFPAVLFKANALPPDLAGATINSATLQMHETWWNGMMYAGVEVRAIHTPATWVAGDGTAGDRWGKVDNGAGRYFANYDVAAGTGVDWLGNVVDTATGFGNNPVETAAMGELIDTQDGVGNGQTTTWNMKSYVQGLANGAYDNDGFMVWMGNATFIVGTYGTLDMRMTRTGEGLVIDYTPVPEPVTMALLALGGLGLLRRRR